MFDQGNPLVQLRSWWHGRSQEERRAIVIGIELAIVVGFAILDLSLGVGLAVLFTLIWLPKLPPLPWRLAVEVALVVLFLVVEPAFGLMLALGFGVSWIPTQRYRVGPAEVSPRGLAVPILAIVIAFTYPFYFNHMFTIPLFGAFPPVNVGVVMLVFVMMAVGLNIVVGYAGLLDLGYVAFYAMGAYTAAWFASLQFPQVTFHLWDVGVSPDLPGFHVSIWLLIALAGVLTAFVGVIIGLPTLRLRGDYLAIVTLGFGEIMPQVARNGDNLFGTGFNLTNGPNGITPIDSPGFGGLNYLQGTGGTFFTSVRLFYWTALVLLLFTVFCSWRLRDSRLGRAWIAIREDEVAAAAMGVPLMRTKTWAYASGAFFGGIAGAYYASFKSATFPGDFFFNISVFILCMVILGGMGNIWGVIVGASFLAYLDQAGLASTGDWIKTNIGIQIDVPLYEFGIFGVILLIVMLFRPQGLLPSSRRAAEFEAGVSDEPLYDAAA